MAEFALVIKYTKDTHLDSTFIQLSFRSKTIGKCEKQGNQYNIRKHKLPNSVKYSCDDEIRRKSKVKVK